jgi:hypothetical protein
MLLDGEAATLGQRDDRLDAPRQWARDDLRNLAVGEGPHKLSRDASAGFVQPPEMVHAW